MVCPQGRLCLTMASDGIAGESSSMTRLRYASLVVRSLHLVCFSGCDEAYRATVLVLSLSDAFVWSFVMSMKTWDPLFDCCSVRCNSLFARRLLRRVFRFSVLRGMMWCPSTVWFFVIDILASVLVNGLSRLGTVIFRGKLL